MNNTAIRVDHLSKQYRIGAAARHDTLRDQLAHGMRSLTAAALAERAGLAAVYSVDGGTARWAAEGRPYEGRAMP